MKMKSLPMSILHLTTLHSSNSPTHPLRDSLLEAHTQNETYVHSRVYTPPADSPLTFTHPTQPLQDSLLDAHPQNEANLSKPNQTRGSKRLHYLTQPKFSQSVCHSIIPRDLPQTKPSQSAFRTQSHNLSGNHTQGLNQDDPTNQTTEPNHSTTQP